MAGTKVPINMGALCDGQVLIPICTVCGGTHIHGISDHKVGDLTHRVGHCMDKQNREFKYGAYWIYIVEEVPDKDFRKYANRRLSIPRKAMLTPQCITEAEARRRYVK